MNEQKATGGIEWTRVWGRRGYTWNPLSGCKHQCRWTMPDGSEAICYAENTAENTKVKAFYPQGFAHHYWHPERLDEPLRVKTPAGVFVGSMSDVFGANVPDEQIQQALDVCQQAYWHIFFLLTKNAPRLLQFEYPPNVWVGASMPADVMFGKRLTDQQKGRMLARTLDVLAQVDAVTWLSAEPLSWDIAAYVEQEPLAIDWCVIGAASKGSTYYAPDLLHLRRLEAVLDKRDIPVFYKGNMKILNLEFWRSSFPNPDFPRMGQRPPALTGRALTRHLDTLKRLDRWNAAVKGE